MILFRAYDIFIKSTVMIHKITHVEMYVANIIQASNFYKNALGFKVIAQNINANSNASNTTVSHILTQGSIYLILTSSVDSQGLVSKQVNIHGDFVKDLAFEVNDIDKIFSNSIPQGFKVIEEPTTIEHQGNKLIKAKIGTFGDVEHTLIERVSYNSDFILVGHSVLNLQTKIPPQFNEINLDHVAIAVDDLDKWTEFYRKGLGFYQYYNETIETKRTGMDSIVMNSTNDLVKFVFIAPKKSTYKSQIEKFLEYNNAPGVQHLAFSTRDIIDTVHNLTKHDIEFLAIPDEYYDNLSTVLKERFQDNFSSIKELGILVDQDSEGYLQQIFTKPLQTKPTFFLEIIQRIGANSFGRNNIMALFQAVEKQLDNQ